MYDVWRLLILMNANSENRKNEEKSKTLYYKITFFTGIIRTFDCKIHTKLRSYFQSKIYKDTRCRDGIQKEL